MCDVALFGLFWIVVLGLISGVVYCCFGISQPTVPCTCPVTDYGMISGTASSPEPPSNLVSGVLRALNFSGNSLTFGIPYSVANNPTKFNIGSVIPGLRPAGHLIYTPVFSGPTTTLEGNASGSMYLSDPDTSNTVINCLIGVAWSTDNVTWNIITQNYFNVLTPDPGFVSFSIPYIVAWTPDQLAGLPVMLTIFLQIVTLSPVHFGVTSLSIVASEVN